MLKETFSPVRRQQKLSGQVAGQIQDLILAKEFKPGDQLPPERAMCDLFQVSRTVIREAIGVLEAKGLLTSQGGSGTYVRALDSKDVAGSIGMYISTQNQSVSLKELIEIRRILEVQIAGLAAERATADGILELEQIMAETVAVMDETEAFASKDLEFHMALARLTQNSLFSILLEPLVDALYEGRRLASTLPGVKEQAIGLHRNILEKIKAGDPEGAASEMSKHLDQSHRVTLEALYQKNNRRE